MYFQAKIRDSRERWEFGRASDAALTDALCLCDSNDKNGAETRKSIDGLLQKDRGCKVIVERKKYRYYLNTR